MRSNGHLRVLILMLSDLMCLTAVWALSIWGYRALGYGYYKFGAEFYLRLWPVAAVYIVINCFFRLYHGRIFYPAAPLNPVEELRRLVGSSFITHLGLIAYLAIAYQTTEHYSRAVILISGTLAAFGAQPLRDLVRFLLRRVSASRIPVVLVGEGVLSDRLEHTVVEDFYLGFRVVGKVGSESDAIVRLGRDTGARTLVTCQDPRQFADRIKEISDWYHHVEYVPTAAAFPVFGGQVVSFDGIGALEMVNQRRMRGLRFEKWLLDKLLSLFAFVLLLPFFIIVPVLVKLTSRGPVFYRQNRLGREGRPIRVWKFRSMYADADERLQSLLATDPVRRAEWEANYKLTDDPRVTPLGRFLRKTSIDEFPQIFNVFAGDMALVGPRPIVEGEVAYYGADYEIFASVKPGITGLWQASGRSDTDYLRRVALDVQYVLNWSPWMDVWILFRTVYAVLFMRGAR